LLEASIITTFESTVYNEDLRGRERIEEEKEEKETENTRRRKGRKRNGEHRDKIKYAPR
jgi:hypothetical protein